MISEDLEPLATPIADLRELPGNPRVGDVGAVARSLDQFGQRKPIVALRDGTIIAGNHTWKAANQLGWEKIAVVYVDDDATTAKAYALADNRTAELGGYDDELLAALIADVQAESPEMLASTGWTEAEYAKLLGQLREAEDLLGDEDDAPEPPLNPVSKRGDVWLLGRHRVVCGDSTEQASADLVLNGELADVMWTDPPYGVDYVGKTKDKLTIKNDGAAGLPVLLQGFLEVATAALRPGAATYIAHPAGPLSLQFGAAILDAGWQLRQSIVWVKDVFALGHSDYHYSHEPIWFSYTPGHEPIYVAYTPGGAGRRGRGGDEWFGDNSQSSVLTYPKPKRSELHPTMKPVALVEHCLKNSTPPGGLVYEPFGGSGSTLLAAQKLGLRAAVIEFDPVYVDVICQRFYDTTGETPTHADTGDAFPLKEKSGAS